VDGEAFWRKEGFCRVFSRDMLLCRDWMWADALLWGDLVFWADALLFRNPFYYYCYGCSQVFSSLALSIIPDSFLFYSYSVD
jgi:hypothetical protein